MMEAENTVAQNAKLKERPYVAPLITVVKIRTERGYAVSLLQVSQNADNDMIEEFTKHGSWQEDNNGFWN